MVKQWSKHQMKFTTILSTLSISQLLSARQLDVEDPSSFNHSSIAVNGHNYHFVDEGPRDAQLIVMCHGFPELWYIYKHQIKHLSEIGYRVVALDMIGYGQTDAPQELSAYTYESVTKDIKDLVPKLGANKAIFLGHDWGSPIAWQMAVSRPEVVDGVISISVPFYGPLPINNLEIIASFIPAISYQLSIANSNIEEMDKDKRKFLDSFLYADPKGMRLMSTAPKTRQILDFIAEQEFNRTSIMNEKDMDYMVSQYTKGTEGPTNWYRTFAANQDYLRATLDRKIDTPALFINSTLDMVNDFGNNNAEHLTNFVEKKVVGGHWVHYTQPAEVNQHIEEWLKEKFPLEN